MSKTLVLEANGIVYVIARQREIKVAVADNATWRDVVAALAQAAPKLVGEVIARDKRHLLGDYLINVAGTVTINDLEARADVKDGAQGAFQVSGRPVTDTHHHVNSAVSSLYKGGCAALGPA